MTLRRLVLVRHGETDYNASNRMQGHFDSHLTRTGWNQARFAVPALIRFGPEVVISSDLRRALDTATVFTDATGIDLRVDKRLRETNLGQWQELTPEEVEEGWPGVLADWRADALFQPPGGESRVEVATRAAELVGELDDEFGETAMLFTHGGLIIGLTAQLLGLPQPSWAQLGGMSNCHWTVLARRPDEPTGPWRLATYNAGITG